MVKCIKPVTRAYVAPYTGAWIEIQAHRTRLQNTQSHPTRVRGLKLATLTTSPIAIQSHPTRVRGLKSKLLDDLKKEFCRTLHGCVD